MCKGADSHSYITCASMCLRKCPSIFRPSSRSNTRIKETSFPLICFNLQKSTTAPASRMPSLAHMEQQAWHRRRVAHSEPPKFTGLRLRCSKVQSESSIVGICMDSMGWCSSLRFFASFLSLHALHCSVDRWLQHTWQATWTQEHRSKPLIICIYIYIYIY